MELREEINSNITETTYGDKYFAMYEQADVVIDLIERPIGLLKAPLEPEKMGLLGAYMQRLFGTCVSKKRMLQLRVPTKTLAESYGIDAVEFVNRMEKAVGIDYAQLQEKCNEFKEEYETKREVTILTGEGKYELKVVFEGRNWGIDAGDGDIPCGEVCIAPVENATNGSIYYKTAYVPGVNRNGKLKRFDNVVLEIVNGVIVNTSDPELTTLVNNAGAANSTVCELGIGMNPGVTSLCGCPLLDEKMIGTFHLGFGDNTMFGGENEADDHYDLVGTGELIWR